MLSLAGGVFPGFLYSLTLFYSPKNLTVRISSFTLAASVAFALGSFLAGVILPIRGALDGWQLLFLYRQSHPHRFVLSHHGPCEEATY